MPATSPRSPCSPALEPSLSPSMENHLGLLCQQLCRASGSVVAFLGAGFMGPLGAQFSSWSFLLKGIAKETQPAAVRDELLRLLAAPGANDAVFQRVAQLAEDNLGEAGLHDVAAKLLTLPAAVYSKEACDELPEAHAEALTQRGVFQFRKRLALLRLLPFRAILTTNFTEFGDNARVVSLPRGGAEGALRELLRGSPRHARMDEEWLSLQEKLLRCFNDDGKTAPPPWSMEDPLIIHLHGTCEDPVVTKLGYRALLHRTPTYLPFMRTLMATSALCYVGFSFTDAYLDEVRSETLSMLSSVTRLSGFSGGGGGGGGGGGAFAPAASPFLPEPLGFALMPIPPGVVGDDSVGTLLEYHRRHEGMAWLAYPVPEGTHDHSACDELLAVLIRRVCVPFKLAEALRQRRLLVFDKVREGFAEKAVPLLSRLVMSTVDARQRDELWAKYQVASAAQAKYIRLYNATKLLKEAEDCFEFEPPERSSEEWPLADGGKIEVIFLSREKLEERLRDAGLPATFGEPAPPIYEREGRQEFMELTAAQASCGQWRIQLEDGRTVTMTNRRTAPQLPLGDPSAPRTFAALITLNGWRGDDHLPMYMSTLALVRALPVYQQMPCLVFGCGKGEELLARDAEYSFSGSLGGVIMSLFSALAALPPVQPIAHGQRAIDNSTL